MNILPIRKVRLYLLVGSLCLIILAPSCNKSKIEPNLSDQSRAIGLKTYKSLTSLAQSEDKKIAYDVLSYEERYAFWSQKLKMASESDAFTEIQKLKIKEVMSALSLDFFKGGDAKEIFKNHFLKNWLESSSKLFTEYQIVELLFTLNPVGATPVANVVLPANCHCAVGAYWTCFRGVQTSDGEYYTTHGKCTKVGACTSSTTGCGALFDDDCNGDTCSNEVED